MGVGWVIFHLLTQLLDEHGDAGGLADEFLTPCSFHQLLFREYDTRVGHERMEDLEFLGCERQPFGSFRGAELDRIDCEAAYAQHFLCDGARRRHIRSSQLCLYMHEQLAWVEGLHHIIIAARLETHALVHYVSYQVYDAKSGGIVAHDAANAEPVLSVADTDIADRYVTIFDCIKAEADKWGKDEIESESGVSYDDIARIARDYAKAKGAIIIQNMGGYQRTENGAYATATQVYLALFCGHIGHKGDGVYDAGGSATLVPSGAAFDTNPDAATYEGIPFPHFAEFVAEDRPCKLNFAWFYNFNPVAQLPNSDSWRTALGKVPFVVTVDMFMTSTGLCSDLVLPCTALFETPNVTHSVRSGVIQISEAGVTPPGEAKTDLEITAEVARRFGFEKYFNEDPSVYIGRVVGPAGITYDELVEKKCINAWDMVPDWIAYEDGRFDTSTGKAHLWVQSWVDEGFPPVACHQRPAEHPLNTDSELAQKYPLASVQRKTRHQVHTTFNNLETMLSLDGRKPTITINDEDAQERGISQGDAVVAYNDRGEHSGIAYVTGHVKKGVVVLENGWDDTTASPSSNVTNNAWPTLGTIHCCNSTLVEVKKGGHSHDIGFPCGDRSLLWLQNLHGRLRQRASSYPRRSFASCAPNRRSKSLVF